MKKGTYEKQGERYTKIILWIFLAAVAAYFGYYIVTAGSQPLTTVAAIEYEAGTGSYTTGFVVRDESVVSSGYSITNLIVSEGERVAKGQTVATGYLTEDAQARQEQIQELELQLQQLEYAVSYSADASDQARLDAEIQSRLLDLTKYLARGDMNSALDLSTGLKGLVLRRSTSAEGDTAMQLSISALKERLAQLQTGDRDETMEVQAQHSGYFSGTVDGYESVLTPEAITSMSVKQAENPAVGAVPAGAIGKVISGDEWFYMAVVPSAYVEKAKLGQTVVNRLGAGADDRITQSNIAGCAAHADTDAAGSILNIDVGTIHQGHNALDGEGGSVLACQRFGDGGDHGLIGILGGIGGGGSYITGIQLKQNKIAGISVGITGNGGSFIRSELIFRACVACQQHGIGVLSGKLEHAFGAGHCPGIFAGLNTIVIAALGSNRHTVAVS